MSNRYPLVLFSGGLDSTYLLYYTLLHKRQSANVIYLDGGQGGTKSSIEKQQRQKILTLLEGLLAEQDLGVTVQDVTHRNPFTSGSNFAQSDRCKGKGGLPQAAAWIAETLKLVGKETHVLIGYVPGDDAAFFWRDIKAAWDAMAVLLFRHDPIPLEAPLLDSWVRKRQMFDALPEAILREIWICELPIDLNWDGETALHHCGKCSACERAISERYQYYLEHRKFPPLPFNPGRIAILEADIMTLSHPKEYGYRHIAEHLGIRPPLQPAQDPLIDDPIKQVLDAIPEDHPLLG